MLRLIGRHKQHTFANHAVTSFQVVRRIHTAAAVVAEQYPPQFSIPKAPNMATNGTHVETNVHVVDPADIGEIVTVETVPSSSSWIDDWQLRLNDSQSSRNLMHAAEAIKTSLLPVAFPTETVYGLGADATRDDAVKGIFKAKQRPSDNPLIVHFSSLKQLRGLLSKAGNLTMESSESPDPIPSIYHPLIAKFWPGPLTILLPLPTPSPLASSVNAGLPTFGARIPRNPIALSLIHLAQRPIAAPSANASTRPSPTAAEHVLHDLEGRIETILDGGPCDVGVESTVVDGLIDPPVVLRPGGVSLEQLRTCPGWENLQIAYKDRAETAIGEVPRAPGMKYRHYSPRAKVHLFEAGKALSRHVLSSFDASQGIGIVTTKRWPSELHQSFPEMSSHCRYQTSEVTNGSSNIKGNSKASKPSLMSLLADMARVPQAYSMPINDASTGDIHSVWMVDLGCDTKDIARGLFSALRELDRKAVANILVEGIDETEGDVAAAVMNRLRKAAEYEIR